MITNEEARKAIEKYQKCLTVRTKAFTVGTIDVTAISSKEGADLISQTIEKISKQVDEDTELWCICEMAKMYMQGVRPTYLERPTGKWTPVSEGLPEINKEVIVTDIETSDTYTSEYLGNGYWECDNGTFKNRVIAWQPLPEPYKDGG